MNRRSFIRSLGGAVAAAMIPFVRPIKLQAPKKAKVVIGARGFWFQSLPSTRCYSEAYKEYLSKMMADAEKAAFTEPMGTWFDQFMKPRK